MAFYQLIKKQKLPASKVAVLIESEDVNMKGLQKSIVLTIIGHAEEIST
ncbi:MAG TPA: hypothetical protein VIK14_01280 [Ignavibacteria bacterium]